MDTFLEALLRAKEERALHQQALLSRYSLPLICLTLNIPGPEKDSPRIRRLFRLGCCRLEAQLQGSGIPLLHGEARTGAGPEGYYVANADPLVLKKLCVQIEEATPEGRLLDLDVLTAPGLGVSRRDLGLPPRGCLICGGPAALCSRSRRHDLPVLLERVEELITQSLQREDRARIAECATESLLWEVAVTPKPGLVDWDNSGSHRDMDRFTFLSSISGLYPYFEQCAALGQRTRDLPPPQVLEQLRPLGKEAEYRMGLRTGGVNTHKGAIFSLGLLCAAAGRLEVPTAPGILTLVGQMAQSVCTELSQSDTAGGHLYRKQGITGIRGQAEAGFPAVAQVGLPTFRQALARGHSLNDAAAITLLHLIPQVQDTTFLSRGTADDRSAALRELQALLEQDPFPDPSAISPLDRHWQAAHLTCGGCADLLALTLFLHRLEG